MGVRLEGFDGLVGREIAPDRRLGTEFSDHAKRHGAGGIFHTDELPAYGVTDEEVADLRDAVDADPEDAVAIVADETDVAEAAIDAVVERAQTALEGVPEETRGANDDGTTRYLRPLPGAARMYPETDVPPVEPDPSEVPEPELLTEKVERYQDEYDLGAGLAEQVAYGTHMPLFEDVVADGIDPTLAASTLESTLTELRRDDVAVENVTETHLQGVLRMVEDGDLPNEASVTSSRRWPTNPTGLPRRRPTRKTSAALTTKRSARQSSRSSNETKRRSQRKACRRSPDSWASAWAHSVGRRTATSSVRSCAKRFKSEPEDARVRFSQSVVALPAVVVLSSAVVSPSYGLL